MPNQITIGEIIDCSDISEQIDNEVDFEYETNLNIDNENGMAIFKTSITSDYDFITEYKKYREYYLDSNTRKILTEKTIK